MALLYVALLHFPVYDKNGDVVTSAVTNMDIHDIARSGRTYGVRRFYVVTPVHALRQLAERILEHWETGHGAAYNRTRKDALEIVRLTEDLERTIIDVEHDAGAPPLLLVTSARTRQPTLGYDGLRRMARDGDRPLLLLFGTGWGLTEEVIGRADYRLPALTGIGTYNHLSVRTAAGIVLDRVCGARNEAEEACT